jgi:hypothetical protein
MPNLKCREHVFPPFGKQKQSHIARIEDVYKQPFFHLLSKLNFTTYLNTSRNAPVLGRR